LKTRGDVISLIEKDDLESIQALMAARGVEFVNQDLPNGAPPLFFAIASDALRVAKALLDAGAVVDGHRDYLPLHAAGERASADAISLLLAHHADPNVVRYDGRTALHCASEMAGSSYAIERLVEAGANLEVVEQVEGLTPLGLAVAVGDLENVSCLLALGADPQVTDAGGLTLVEIAEAEGHLEVLRRLSQLPLDR